MWDYKNRSDEIRPDFKMAPQVGLEPTTLRLTAGCSAIELLRSVLGARPEGAASFVVIHNIIGGGVWGFQSCARQRAALGRLVFAAAYTCAAQLTTYTSNTPHVCPR